MTRTRYPSPSVLQSAALVALLGACVPEEGPDASVAPEDRLAAAEELARGGGEDHGRRSGHARDAWLRLARWYREIYTPPIDFNGDGYADVAAGLHNSSDEQVAIYLGGPSGLPSTPSQVIPSPDPSAYLAFWRACAVGDVNGDGYGDLVVGANNASTNGAAYLFLGSASGLSTTPDQVIDATATGLAGVDAFGVQVAPARDVDLDGYDDVLIGATASDLVDIQDGAAFLFRGGPSGLEATPTRTFTGSGGYLDNFGQSMTATYINHDRYPDLVISETRNPLYGGSSAGRLHVYLGSRSGFSSTPDQVLSSPDADFEAFGLTVSRVGDINLDGHGDIIVSEPIVDGYDGRAYVYLGTRSGLDPVPALQLEPPASGRGGYFGWDVGGGGDVDGNGLADLVVGETDANSLEGEAHAWFGPFFVRPGDSANPRVLTPDASVVGTHTGTGFFGQQISLGGDVDGNGIDDFLIGAPWAGDRLEGRLYRFEGSSTYTLDASAVQTIDGSVSYGRLGLDLSR